MAETRSLTRLTLAGLSLGIGLVVALAVVASWPFAQGNGFLLALAGAGVVCLCLGLLAIWIRGLAWGIALLAATFLLRVQLEPATTSAWTPVVAGALLLLAELGYWSFELAGDNPAGSGTVGRRLVEILLLAAGATVLCELVLDLGTILPVAGSWMLVLGAIAVVGLLALLLRLARRAEP